MSDVSNTIKITPILVTFFPYTHMAYQGESTLFVELAYDTLWNLLKLNVKFKNTQFLKGKVIILN